MQCRSFLFLSCLLLLPPLHAWAQAGVAADMEMDPDAMAQRYASMGDPGNAARMSDSDASCEQLYAESEYLDARVAALPRAADPMEASARMQREIMEAQKKAMNGMRAKSMASSLLGMVPGVGGIAGSLASSAMGRGDGGMGAMNDATRKMMREMAESNRAMMAASQLQMRNSHVTGLFLSRDCKVSRLDHAAVATARANLESSGGAPAGSAPASHQPEAQAPDAGQSTGAAQ
ncbi:MAG: hypothetical protein ABWY48_09450 [Pseudoxanthomonas sp.]